MRVWELGRAQPNASVDCADPREFDFRYRSLHKVTQTDGGDSSCTCPAFSHHTFCSHVIAVQHRESVLALTQHPDNLRVGAPTGRSSALKPQETPSRTPKFPAPSSHEGQEQDQRQSTKTLAKTLDFTAVAQPALRQVYARKAPLTTAENETVDAALCGEGNDDTVVTSMFHVDLKRRDLRTLEPGIWLNDEVINFWMQLLHQRERRFASLPHGDLHTVTYCRYLRQQRLFQGSLLLQLPHKEARRKRWLRQRQKMVFKEWP